MGGDNSSAVQRVINNKVGKDDVWVGGLMRTLGALEVKRKLCFQAKDLVGGDNALADAIIRCEPSKTNAELKRQRLGVFWREHVMGGEEKCSAILQGDTRSGTLRHELTTELGGWG